MPDFLCFGDLRPLFDVWFNPHLVDLPVALDINNNFCYVGMGIGNYHLTKRTF